MSVLRQNAAKSCFQTVTQPFCNLGFAVRGAPAGVHEMTVLVSDITRKVPTEAGATAAGVLGQGVTEF